MTLIAQLDNTRTPAVVVSVFDYGADAPPASMAPPDFRDVTAIKPTPLPGYTFDGAAWAPGVIQALQANQQNLSSKAQAALNANATFQALASPTNAQTLAQVQLLTREANALIRLALGLFDSTAGT